LPSDMPIMMRLDSKKRAQRSLLDGPHSAELFDRALAPGALRSRRADRMLRPASPSSPSAGASVTSAATSPRSPGGASAFGAIGGGPLKGDVFAYSLPASLGKSRRSRRKVQKAASAASLAAPAEKVYVDPFTEWRQSMVDVNKMSYAQLMGKTWEGQKKVRDELKYQNRMFKQVDLRSLDELSPERLFENRVVFSKFGVRAAEIGRQREEAWRQRHNPPSEKEMQRLKEEKYLFSYYGVGFSKGRSEPNLKDLRKLMHECHERSEIVQEQRAREAEERQRVDELQRQEAELERQRVQKEKLGGLSLGRTGESILKFA